MFDFDRLIDRRNSNCIKWDLVKDTDVIPMWVADMDFEAAPCIKEALMKRVEHGVFGYTLVPESYYEAVQGWFARRHGFTIARDWMLYTSGVVPGIACVLKALTMPGENVLVQTPVYNCFFSCIKNAGCNVLENRLVRRDDTYEIDFEDFEAKCADEKTTVFLLCNPHNPGGRVWRKEELERMNDICLRHGVRVVCDEIHCEFVMPGYQYTPFATVSEACLKNVVTLNAPSKAFNIAGLQISNIICENAEVRRRIDRAININEVCDVNPFGVVALEAAYREGEPWIDELNVYLRDNYKALRAFIVEHKPEWTVMRQEGTYVVWVDVSAMGKPVAELEEWWLKERKVYVNAGTHYGDVAGEGYIRINIACPRSRMLEGLSRLCR